MGDNMTSLMRSLHYFISVVLDSARNFVLVLLGVSRYVYYSILAIIIIIIIVFSLSSTSFSEALNKIAVSLFMVFLSCVIFFIYCAWSRMRKEQIKTILAKKRYDLIAALVGYVHERVCDYRRFGYSDPVLLSYTNLKAFFTDEGVNLTNNEVLQLNNAAVKEWGIVNFSPKEWEEKVMKGFFSEINNEHLKLIDGFTKSQKHEDVVDECEFDKFTKLLHSEQCYLSRQELMTFFTFRMYQEVLVKFDLIAEKAKKASMDAILPDIMFCEGDELEGSIKLLSDALLRHGFKPEECAFNVISAKLETYKQKSEINRYKENLLSGPISIEAVIQMKGTEFEKFLEKLFRRMNYHVEHKGKTGDQGADLIIERGGERIVVQAKGYDNKVSNDAVQEVGAAVKHYCCDKAMVVTNNYFHPSAKELAQSNNVELIDRNTLIDWIKKYY